MAIKVPPRTVSPTVPATPAPVRRSVASTPVRIPQASQGSSEELSDSEVLRPAAVAVPEVESVAAADAETAVPAADQVTSPNELKKALEKAAAASGAVPENVPAPIRPVSLAERTRIVTVLMLENTDAPKVGMFDVADLGIAVMEKDRQYQIPAFVAAVLVDRRRATIAVA